MALPMLIGGAECGPINPLQGLSKRSDADRGLQQDFFGPGRAGSSRETFRTQRTGTPSIDQDAARFFAPNASAAPQIGAPNAFDLSALHGSLPPSHILAPGQTPHLHQPNATGAWASDFMQLQPMQNGAPQAVNVKPEMQLQQETGMALQQPVPGMPNGVMMWTPAYSGFRMSQMPNFAPAMPVHDQKSATQTNQSLWDKEFQSQEISLNSLMPVVPLQEVQQSQQMGEQGPIDQDELARTAGLLVDSVQNEQNPKFQNSQFLGLMKQLRDRTVVVEGNQMVERPAATTSSWAGDFQADVKGKGRAVEPLIAGSNQMSMSAPRGLASDPTQINRDQEDSAMQEDPNDAYFRQENEEYTRYWNEVRTKTPPPEDVFVEPSAWDQLQQEWEAFEATSVGIKPVNNYQFQSNNPYVLGDSSTRTRNHLLHTGGHQSFFENVLELEATVQRDPSNATAWFQLGVKQQEAEREQKAIQALLYAADLDPTHLPTWLALAVSYTNDGKRNDTYNAIRKWVDLNSRYAGAVQEYLTQSPENPSATITDRFSHLIQCLISMARSNTSSEVDADIQIALAVLLNTNEDYEKAQDCFRTALAVRPEDWLLYNRVGATMANSGHAEEALQYYYRALELNPAYIRARFNLGISCINLRRYEEAAQHILDALVLQDSDGVQDPNGLNDGRGITSRALWDSLKTTCLHMQRVDLATLCDRKDLEGFRSAFQA